VTIAGKQGSIKLRRVDQFNNALTSSAGEAHFVCSSAGPEPLETQVIECGNGIVDIRRALAEFCCPLTGRGTCFGTYSYATSSALGHVTPSAQAWRALVLH